ncbi:MAG: response regulator [Bdellovibrio sp.]|nr:response regulator [Bdellovibrio sp.]
MDDMKGIRIWLTKSLKDLGYTEILEAADGVEALQILQSNHIELLLTDIIMPKKTGLELLQEMLVDPKLAKIPTIVLSAETDREMIVKAVELGVLTYIIKPATMPALQKKLEEAYKRLNP